MEIQRTLKENLELLRPKLGIDSSFDVMLREFLIGQTPAAMLYLDGFIQSQVTSRVLEHLMKLTREDILPNPIEKLIQSHIPYFEVATIDNLESCVDEVLAGQAVLLLDGCTRAIAIDLRQYPNRSIDEPDLERVTRGSHDGFVETALFNVNMIRRRLRDPGLRFEAVRVGRRSKTDVFIGYVNDIANLEWVNHTRELLQSIDTVSLTMGAKTLEGYLVRSKLNPFPTVRYTERPDVVVAHLLEGHIVLLTDTTPTAMLFPASAWHFTQHAEEYFQNPTVGTYLKWVRFLAILVAFLMTPLWFLLAANPQLRPEWLQWLGPRTGSEIPLFLQLVILELAIDLTRMAFIHTPSALASSLGLVAAILLGDFAVQVGLFVPEAILYQATSAIGFFALPNYEFSLALRIFKILTLILTGFFGLYGFLGGIGFTLAVMGATRSLDLPYLWPLIPFDWVALKRLILRYPIPEVTRRPKRLKTQDEDLA